MSSKEDELKAWRLILDQLYPLETLPVLITCKDFNELYSEEDWRRFLKQLVSSKEEEINFRELSETTKFRESYTRPNIRKGYIIKSKERLDKRLEIIEKIDGPFPDILWKELSLTAKYYIFDARVQKIQKETDRQQNESLKKMRDCIEELVEKYPQMKEKVEGLIQVARESNPDQEAIAEEFLRVLKEDPSGEGMKTFNKICETNPSLCCIL